METYQGSLAEAPKSLPNLFPFFGVVVEVYSDRMTCDIAPPPIQPYVSGSTNVPQAVFFNVPIRTEGGIDPQTNEIWGKVELPQINDFVLVGYAGPYSSEMVVIGTIFPYTMNFFQSDQTPVNSSNKQFSTKLLVAGEPKVFRKIFQSGTSVEVAEDGSVTIETPSGSYIQMDETGDDITIEPKNKVSIKNATQNLYALLSNLQTALNDFSDATAQLAITGGNASSSALATALNGLLGTLNTSVVTFGTDLGELMQ